MVRFGAAAGIPPATASSRSRSITLDNPVVTVGLRSSVRATRSRRSQGRVEAGKALPEEAISPGGSSVQAVRLSTWWRRPGGSLTLTAVSYTHLRAHETRHD